MRITARRAKLPRSCGLDSRTICGIQIRASRADMRIAAIKPFCMGRRILRRVLYHDRILNKPTPPFKGCIPRCTGTRIAKPGARP